MRIGKTIVLMLTAGLLSLSACQSLVYDEGQDACDVAIRFRYEYNMKYADAFANEVHSVAVYVFDPATGALVTTASDAGKHLDEHYYFTIPELKKGKYDLVAWCGLAENDFVVEKPASKADLFCRMSTKTKASHYTDTDPGALYYGYAEGVDLDVLPPGSVNTVIIPLIKNTNNIKVMLQALNSSEQIEPDDYTFVISDNNAVVDWQDGLSQPLEVDYYPWDLRRGRVEYDEKGTILTACVAEFTVNRLFPKVTEKTMLSVIDKVTGQTVIHIPIVDYFLMVKGNYHRSMTEQEYLDRQDDYQITFFLDNTRGWNLAAGIYINGWHVILMDTNLD